MNFEFEIVPALIVLVCVLAAWLAVHRMRALGKKDLPDLRKVVEGVALVVVVVAALVVGRAAESMQFCCIISGCMKCLASCTR